MKLRNTPVNLTGMSGVPKYTTYSDLKLPKYVSYTYHGTTSPQCKKVCFFDRFKKKPQVTRKDADLCKDSYGEDDHDGGRVE